MLYLKSGWEHTPITYCWYRHQSRMSSWNKRVQSLRVAHSTIYLLYGVSEINRPSRQYVTASCFPKIVSETDLVPSNFMISICAASTMFFIQQTHWIVKGLKRTYIAQSCLYKPLCQLGYSEDNETKTQLRTEGLKGNVLVMTFCHWFSWSGMFLLYWVPFFTLASSRTARSNGNSSLSLMYRG